MAASRQFIFEQLRDYEQRCRDFQPAAPVGEDTDEAWDGVVFRVGGYRLTCPIGHIEEILEVPAITPVPRSKPWLLGLANVRGNLATIVDLGWFVTGTRTPISGRSRLLMLRLMTRPLGILVDEVYGQRHFNDAGQTQPQLERMPNAMQEFVVMDVEAENVRWSVFNFEHLFEKQEFLSGAAETTWPQPST